MVGNWGVNGRTDLGHSLSIVHSQAHVEIVFATVNVLMPRSCRHAVIVSIGSLLVPCESELFFVDRVCFLEEIPADFKLVDCVLVVRLEKFGWSNGTHICVTVGA